jgi:hypothetical protein
MGHLNQLVKYPQELVFDGGHGVLVVHLPISLNHFDNQEGVFEFIVDGVSTLILYDSLDCS